ncbi:uncharacterized protein [Physcomitrium patens]|uniref:uncharacterized protein isoform X7 n=1 Tax=Physcomitrium patens TaxID=3218 RepID=UPI003CCCFDB6
MRRVYHPPRRVPHLGTSLRTGSSPGNAAFLLLPLCLCFRFLLPFSGRLKGVGFLLGSTCFAIAGSSMPFLPTFLQHLWNKLMKFFQKTGGFYIAGLHGGGAKLLKLFQMQTKSDLELFILRTSSHKHLQDQIPSNHA